MAQDPNVLGTDIHMPLQQSPAAEILRYGRQSWGVIRFGLFDSDEREQLVGDIIDLMVQDNRLFVSAKKLDKSALFKKNALALELAGFLKTRRMGGEEFVSVTMKTVVLIAKKIVTDTPKLTPPTLVDRYAALEVKGLG